MKQSERKQHNRQWLRFGKILGAAAVVCFFMQQTSFRQREPYEGPMPTLMEEERALMAGVENGIFLHHREFAEYPGLVGDGAVQGPEGTGTPGVTQGPEGTGMPGVTQGPEGGSTPGVTEGPEGGSTPGVTQEEKICYLTFDDGPSANTGKVLDILKQYNVRATFFVIGECITEETAPMLRRIVAEGHYIGLHANVHTYRTLYATRDSYFSDMELLCVRLRQEFGITTRHFRFPGGSACVYLQGRGKEWLWEMRDRGLYCVDWNVSGEDSVGAPTPKSIEDNVFRDAFRYREPVVLLHDSANAPNTVQALPVILERLLAEGYRFETLAHTEGYVFPKNR